MVFADKSSQFIARCDRAWSRLEVALSLHKGVPIRSEMIRQTQKKCSMTTWNAISFIWFYNAVKTWGHNALNPK